MRQKANIIDNFYIQLITILQRNCGYSNFYFQKLIDIPLLIGELSPLTSASEDINRELRKERPRDISIPRNNH